MKHLDKFSRRVLAVGTSLSMVILAAALFLQTMPFAKADSFPESLSAAEVGDIQAEGIQSVGKYDMKYQMVYDPGENKIHHFIVVLDTETAASRIYYRDGADYKLSSGQLPERPI